LDSELRRLQKLDTPATNPILMNGLAIAHMSGIPDETGHKVNGVEQYIDQVFKSASKGFPEGLEYRGCKRCNVDQEYGVVTKAKTSKRMYDVARSDIYMMNYFFSYKGVDLPARPMYLPFVGDAGTLFLGGSRFNISPILSDRVISIGVSNIFVRLLRDRLTFERMGQHYMVDGRRETVQVAWAAIYHKNAKMRKLKATVKANCTLVHYLLCKYGFAETFERFGHCQPIVGGAEVNKNVYSEDEWVICTSTQVKPKGCGRGFYEPSSLRVAIRKEQMTPMVRNMLGGFFYILDHFPSMIKAEYFNDANEKRLWKILLGHIIFSGTINAGKLHDDIEAHMTSLDEYLDQLVILKLRDIDVFVDDVYQLFAEIIETFNDRLLAAADKVASVYDKELSILYYVLYDITASIFKLYFKLKAASKKELTAKEITATMNLTLRTGAIFSMTKNHGEVSNVSNPGDNKAFKVTAILTQQGDSSKLGNRKARTTLNDPTKRLHVSVAEVCGAFNLPKSAPDGRSRLNPHLKIDAKGVVLRDPTLTPMLDQTQEYLRR